MIRGLMTDEEWAFFAPFVIEAGPKRGRPPRNHRKMLDGVFRIARTGAPWRDLPPEFGKWASVCRQFRRWTLSGLWELLLEALNDGGDALDGLQMIDSTVARAHHCAAGQGGMQDHGLGRSRGGLSTKIHLRANGAGPPVAVEITGGRVSDCRGHTPLMEADGPPAKVLLGDRGCDADFISNDMQARGGVAAIPPRRTRRVRESVDGHVHPLRNRIERCFNFLKNARRVATRYDKTAASCLGFVHLASRRLWIRHFVNTP